MVFKPAYFEVCPFAIDPNNVYAGLDLSGVCLWVEKYKGDPRYSGRFCKSSLAIRSSAGTNLESTLDKTAAENGEIKTPKEWVKYWNNINDGRFMASAGELYANFKIIKHLSELGSSAEKTMADNYTQNLRENFKLNGIDGGIICDTWFVYSAISLDASIIQHHWCNKPELIKETRIEVPIYKQTKIEEMKEHYLQALFNTKDNMGTIVRTVEFISGKDRSEVCGWTAANSLIMNRTSHPNRVTTLFAHGDNVYLNSTAGSLNHRGHTYGIRIK